MGLNAMNGTTRRSIGLGAASLAVAAGAGFAWWRYRPDGSQDAAVSALWALNLELPDGKAWAFQSLRGKPIVVNFWATWCPPCVEELPLLEQFYQLNSAKSWQVVGIAVDNAKAVQKFLGKTPLSFPTPLAGLAGVDLSRTLGNLSGGLPFTVVLNAAGEVALRHMGKLSASQINDFSTLK
jgi:thiol-disulfide isomerase/thioredoxin